VDFVELETSKGGFNCILVINYGVVISTINTTAHTTAEAFINNFVVYQGFENKIHKD